MALTQTREPDPRVEEAFERFWDATAPADVAAAADAVAGTGVSFDGAMARLKSGRRYSGAVLTGVLSAAPRRRVRPPTPNVTRRL